jgi:cell division transport system ATP-binding protein
VIHIRDLSYRFGDRYALRGVSFSVEKGRFAFLTGPSGSGKTTLLRILHGALPMQEGRAGVAGCDLSRLNAARMLQLRREVAVIFQDFKILSDRSVYDNIALPLRVRGVDEKRIRPRVEAVMTALRLDGDATRPCRALAGGEQQRVAIARAVVAGPRLLLADEPTGNLDWELALRLLDVLRQVNAYGTTVLMATHNRDLLAAMPDAPVIRLGGASEGDTGGFDLGKAVLSEPEAAP